MEARTDACSLLFEDAPDEALAFEASADRQAFAELYRRYFEPVYRYIRYQAPADEANDLTSQVFFSAYRASAQFRGESSYRSWLFRIAHNTVVSWRRRNDHAPVLVPDFPDPEDQAPDGAERMEKAEASRMVAMVVRELKPLDRELLALRYVEDLSPKEIAHATGQSPGAVRIRLHRLLRRLRRLLEDKGVRE